MPSSPGYKRNYKQEAANEDEKRKHDRMMRMRARREMEKKGAVHRHDGRQVDHIKPLSKGGGNKDNLRVRSQKANSSYQRTSSGKMKYSDQR